MDVIFIRLNNFGLKCVNLLTDLDLPLLLYNTYIIVDDSFVAFKLNSTKHRKIEIMTSMTHENRQNCTSMRTQFCSGCIETYVVMALRTSQYFAKITYLDPFEMLINTAAQFALNHWLGSTAFKVTLRNPCGLKNKYIRIGVGYNMYTLCFKQYEIGRKLIVWWVVKGYSTIVTYPFPINTSFSKHIYTRHIKAWITFYYTSPKTNTKRMNSKMKFKLSL